MQFYLILRGYPFIGDNPAQSRILAFRFQFYPTRFADLYGIRQAMNIGNMGIALFCVS